MNIFKKISVKWKSHKINKDVKKKNAKPKQKISWKQAIKEILKEL